MKGIILSGMPAVGKTTVANSLCKEFDIKYYSGGDMLKEIAKEEGIMYLASEQEKIMRMNHEEALKELIKISKIESKIQKIESICDNDLFNIK